MNRISLNVMREFAQGASMEVDVQWLKKDFVNGFTAANISVDYVKDGKSGGERWIKEKKEAELEKRVNDEVERRLALRVPGGEGAHISGSSGTGVAQGRVPAQGPAINLTKRSLEQVDSDVDRLFASNNAFYDMMDKQQSALDDLSKKVDSSGVEKLEKRFRAERALRKRWGDIKEQLNEPRNRIFYNKFYSVLESVEEAVTIGTLEGWKAAGTTISTEVGSWMKALLAAETFGQHIGDHLLCTENDSVAGEVMEHAFKTAKTFKVQRQLQLLSPPAPAHAPVPNLPGLPSFHSLQGTYVPRPLAPPRFQLQLHRSPTINPWLGEPDASGASGLEETWGETW
eukprot:TRINITY_DN14797_c0_g1_i6.p1 TRINITY_DN14797_c0_g1~~TRINITY_DN14797_c0_g1_i6.p1  ORF type:complete len:342 (+),score=62.41 TRINITY_DN14797_c0_g1_i6:729-1754(+)